LIRVALDSNVLVYRAMLGAAGPDAVRAEHADALFRRLLPRCRLVVPGQVLGELYNVLTRQGRPRQDARELVRNVAAVGLIAPATPQTYTAALDLAATHKLQYWDALILTSAAEAGCALLLSEDLHDGFAHAGCTVANPFATALHPQLAELLA
jgi:predicted nucleic acid-binding protein